MATRCNLIITDGSHMKSLYHHFDGYMAGVGETLKAFSQKFVSFKEELKIEEFINELIDIDNGFEDDSDMQCLNIHGDIEYLYIVHIDDNKKLLKLLCIDLIAYASELKAYMSYSNLVIEIIHDELYMSDKINYSMSETFKGNASKIINMPHITSIADMFGFQLNENEEKMAQDFMLMQYAKNEVPNLTISFSNKKEVYIRCNDEEIIIRRNS